MCKVLLPAALAMTALLPLPCTHTTHIHTSTQIHAYTHRYVVSQPYDLERSFQDSSPGTPILALLSPGVDVVRHSRRPCCL